MTVTPVTVVTGVMGVTGVMKCYGLSSSIVCLSQSVR